jgi:hypothetical protein
MPIWPVMMPSWFSLVIACNSWPMMMPGLLFCPPYSLGKRPMSSTAIVGTGGQKGGDEPTRNLWKSRPSSTTEQSASASCLRLHEATVRRTNKLLSDRESKVRSLGLYRSRFSARPPRAAATLRCRDAPMLFTCVFAEA